MKMYLSSFRLGDQPQVLAGLVGSNKRAAVIANALDFSGNVDRRRAFVQREIDDLKSLGLKPEEVDLRDYFGKPEELAQKLSGNGMVWVTGGNTFVLRRAFKASGMDEWLIGQRDNQEFVYAGFSAGVCVLSPSLHGLEKVDPPNDVPSGYPNGVIWEGLGLIDFAFAPHYRSNHTESEAVDDEVAYYKERGIKFRALHDGEVIVID
jgi:dipeptidase E